MDKEEDRTGKQTRVELIAGVIVFSVVFLIGNLLAIHKMAYTLGLCLGAVVAVCMVLHMYATLERAMLYDQDTAKKKIRMASMLRMVFMIAALVIAVIVPKYISVLGVLLGILSLKFSAYVQPLTHKVFLKFIIKGR